MRASIIFVMKFMEHKSNMFIGYLALLLECLTPIVAILLQREMIDRVFIDGIYQDFPLLLVLFAIFYFGPKLCFTIRKVLFFSLSYDVQKKMTEVFLAKIYSLTTATFNEKQSAKLLNTIRNDIRDLCNISINQLLSETVKILLSIIFLTFTIAFISIEMLIVVFFIALLYYGLLGKFGEKTKNYAKKVREEKANVSVQIEENISGVRELLAYNRQEWQLSRYDKSFNDYYSAVIKESIYKVKVAIISDPFLYATKLMVVLLGGIAAMQQSITLGELVVSFTLVDQLVTALGSLFQQALIGKRLEAASNNVLKVLNEEDEKFGDRIMDEPIESIAFNNVSFAYSANERAVLSDLSLQFPIGKKIALVGESGCGKSTIAQLLLRMHKVQKGSITINGIDINEINDHYKEKVSLVFQHPHFIPSSIHENLCFDKVYEKEDLETLCMAMSCHDFIQAYPDEYQTMLGERGASLSGGQKQRLALTRALLMQSELLILDEATSALDTETEHVVQKNIDRIRKGKTTIIIAHRLSTIQNADIIYVLDRGKLIAQGSHHTLIDESKVYRSLYQSAIAHE